MKPLKSTPELLALIKLIEDDPKSLNPDKKSLYKYNPLARRNLDKLARAITENLRIKRESEGNPVSADGYSGRQSNKR